MPYSRTWLVALCVAVLAWSTTTTLVILGMVDGGPSPWAPMHAVLLSASGISIVSLVVWHRTRRSEDVFREGLTKGRRLERSESAARYGRRHGDPEWRPNTAELRVIRGSDG